MSVTWELTIFVLGEVQFKTKKGENYLIRRNQFDHEQNTVLSIVINQVINSDGYREGGGAICFAALLLLSILMFGLTVKFMWMHRIISTWVLSENWSCFRGDFERKETRRMFIDIVRVHHDRYKVEKMHFSCLYIEI